MAWDVQFSNGHLHASNCYYTHAFTAITVDTCGALAAVFDATLVAEVEELSPTVFTPE